MRLHELFEKKVDQKQDLLKPYKDLYSKNRPLFKSEWGDNQPREVFDIVNAIYTQQPDEGWTKAEALAKQEVAKRRAQAAQQKIDQEPKPSPVSPAPTAKKPDPAATAPGDTKSKKRRETPTVDWPDIETPEIVRKYITSPFKKHIQNPYRAGGAFVSDILK
jgi:hypothetical protein